MDEICDRTSWSLSKVARTLIEIGIEIEKEGGLIVEGLFFTRLFAAIDFRKPEERVGFQIPREIKEMAVDVYVDTSHIAVRKAMLNALAILKIGKETYTIRGPFRGPRPFVKIEQFPDPTFGWKPAKEAWERICMALKLKNRLSAFKIIFISFL